MIILGIIDVISALLLSQTCLGMELMEGAVLVFSLAILGKGVFFLVSGDLGSIMDVGAGLLLLSLVWLSPPCSILFAVATIIALKGVVTFL